MTRQNVILLILAVVLAAAPLMLLGEAKFGGSDDQAKDLVAEIRPDYKPWFNYIWEPPSPEVESLMFSLQAALGAGFVGYFFGFRRGKQAALEREGEHVIS